MLSSSAARLLPVATTAVSQSGNMMHARPQTADHTVRLAATWDVVGGLRGFQCGRRPQFGGL